MSRRMFIAAFGNVRVGGKSLRELILDALGKELSHDEFERRLQSRSRVRLSRPAGEVLAEVRAERQR
jgi:hypothetical protein